MIPDPHSRRFDPRWLLPTIGMDGAELSGAPDAAPDPTAEAPRTKPTGPDFDEALEQIVSNECRICPLCGAIVARDGSVVG
jgi:hypothetical protein